MYDNPLRTRADLQAALRELVAPLERFVSPGGARLRLGATGAHYPDACAELEGFARPLWGLAPLAAGGGSYAHWPRFARGLAAGSDPDHAEFWGWPSTRNQRLVEMAAIGFALALAPEATWAPLADDERAHLVAWLRTINHSETSDNNWHFFRVLVNIGLCYVGEAPDEAALRRSLDRIDEFYLGDGWYNDGPSTRVQRDYYVPFALHFYGLIYAQLMGQQDPERAGRYRERATHFAQDFVHWFAPDGAALPFGRSLTYRFAQGSFWGALAYAGVEALPWGVMKGLLLRHLRWWLRRPIYHSDGTLSIGYAYPNLNMAEDYNSPGSPYWALKAFLPLALPDEHPFWQAAELPLPVLPAVKPQPHAGMVLCRDGDHVFALSGLQHAAWARGGEAKYSRMAYSTQFGVSVPAGPYGLVQGAFDNTLALSEDGQHFRARIQPLMTNVSAEGIYSRWQPWPDVEVETWLLPRLPWHVRIHHIRSGRALRSAEGGWAVDRSGD
ncbi:DUF2264 domain-containing protein, partial [Candidatus Gracilibacteria bacterium]|nr:DUF2264 domain-containing protein [Candidatus Gracilibacteria bacterium]